MSQLRLTDFPEPDPPAAEEETIPKPKVSLRPYQVEAYEAWLSKGCQGVIVAPTGTGKTIIAAHAIKQSGQPTLVVVPTERILKTWLAALKRNFDIEATAFYGREKRVSSVTVSIYNSVVRHPEVVEGFRMVILDEAHHVAAEVFCRILELVRGRAVMGLTATLSRADGRHMEILARLPLVYVLDIKTAIENGYVSNIQITPVPAPLTKREMDMYREIDSKIMLTRMELAQAKALSDTRMMETLERRLRILLNRRRQLLSKIPSKRAKVLEIVKQCEDDRIIVFSESIESIEALKAALNTNGISAETYHSGKPERERDAVFSGWGKDFRVLLAVRALDEGVDVPEVKTGIIIASGKATRQLVQRQGRLIRRIEGKTARLYVVYAENTYEYGIFLKLKGILRGWVRPY